MSKITRRGFDENDKRWFSEKELIRLKKAHEEIKWLLDRDYKLDSLITFIGDRYQFSLRQRNALKRSTCSTTEENLRKSKELNINELNNKTINIDGFNLIITLEVALSNGTLIMGNDNNIRDLAGLRGTYKLIDKTDLALDLLYKFLKEMKVTQINLFLDSPVSNSANLKLKILDYSAKYKVPTDVLLVNNADVILEKLDFVVTSDSAILDKCINYFNLSKAIICKYLNNITLINFLL